MNTPQPNASWKVTLLMVLMFLVTVLGVNAIEREGEILFPEKGGFFIEGTGYTYLLDTTQDGIEDTKMTLIYDFDAPADAVNSLRRYLQPGARVIYEDEGLRTPNAFGAARMIGFIRSNGQYVRLDQMFAPNIVQRYFPWLYAKIQAEQRAAGR